MFKKNVLRWNVWLLLSFGLPLSVGADDTTLDHPGFALSTLDGSGNVGQYSSVTIGADDLALISYYDATNGDLKVAHCANVACTSATLTTVDSAGDVGQYSSVTIGTDGLALISYYDATNGDLKVAHCADSACTSATRTTMDSAGNVGQYNSVTIGTDGLALISYYDETNGDLKMAHCADLACTSATRTTLTFLQSEGNVGLFTSVTITGGHGLITYYDSTDQVLKLAFCPDLACTSPTVTNTPDRTGNVGQYSSVTIGTDGRALISYYDATNGDLKVAHCADSADSACPSVTRTTLQTEDNVGQFTSITIGTDGLGLISYYDATNGDLKVAHCADSACTSATRTTLQSEDNVGQFTSVTIGTDGLGLITYYDVTNGSLKVAHCANVACTSAIRTTLDGGAHNVGAPSSMIMGADGLGLISYYDTTNGDLKVAHCVNVACTSATRTTLDGGAHNVGAPSSMIMGADSLGLISYYDATNGDLKVAHCANVACTSATLATVDSIGSVGQYNSVTIGADGLALISYHDETSGDLKVAHCANVTCTSATLITMDSPGTVGQYSSVTIGSDGLALISYYDKTNGDLKVAHCANLFCVPYHRRR
jgi:cell shape-determining protein MreC